MLSYTIGGRILPWKTCILQIYACRLIVHLACFSPAHLHGTKSAISECFETEAFFLEVFKSHKHCLRVIISNFKRVNLSDKIDKNGRFDFG